jgi:hypothetical protein
MIAKIASGEIADMTTEDGKNAAAWRMAPEPPVVCQFELLQWVQPPRNTASMLLPSGSSTKAA